MAGGSNDDQYLQNCTLYSTVRRTVGSGTRDCLLCRDTPDPSCVSGAFGVLYDTLGSERRLCMYAPLVVCRESCAVRPASVGILLRAETTGS